MNAIDIPANEQGKVRVFSVSLPDAEADAMSGQPTALAAALGLEQLEPLRAEMFRTNDLEGVGLVAYLTDGTGVVASQVEKDRARLAALDGWIMVVENAGFGSTTRTLRPIPALTLIGTYDEEKPDMTQTLLESEAARPYSGTTQMTPPTPPRGRAGGSLVIAGLAVLVILLLWWALS